MNTEFFIKSLKLLAAIALGSALTVFIFLPFAGFMLNTGSNFYAVILAIFLPLFLISLGYLFQKVSGFDNSASLVSSVIYFYFSFGLILKSFFGPLSMFTCGEGLAGFGCIVSPLYILLIFIAFSQGFKFALRNKKKT